MALILTKDFYGVEIPVKAKIYGVNVQRIGIADKDNDITSHRYDAEISLKYFSEKTGEEMTEKAEIIFAENISKELVALVMPRIYQETQGKIGGESDEPETE